MAQKLQKASDEDIKLGWTAGFSMVNEVTEKIMEERKWQVGPEEVQYTIEVLIEMGFLEMEN